MISTMPPANNPGYTIQSIAAAVKEWLAIEMFWVHGWEVLGM